jgi:hypothetical protein
VDRSFASGATAPTQRRTSHGEGDTPPSPIMYREDFMVTAERAHRRGRPVASELATDVARPRSVQRPCSAIRFLTLLKHSRLRPNAIQYRSRPSK